MLLHDSVFVEFSSDRGGYGPRRTLPAPELKSGEASTQAEVLVRGVLSAAGLDSANFGGSTWNPLACLVPEGAKILVKPNWVFHENRSGEGLECLVTHTSVLLALVPYLAKARPAQLIFADAPIQSCDFDVLRRDAGLDELVARARSYGIDRVAIRDLRKTVMTGNVARQTERSGRNDSDFREVDLGAESLLEEITSAEATFRVTNYDPRRLSETHGRGVHRYLIATEALDADVVVNVPKLKTHMKAGITGALKNMVGINGLKDYLPHHRKGGHDDGGDCYPSRSPVKRLIEDLLDSGNQAPAGVRRTALLLSASVLRRGLGAVADGNLEGSWFGNDTVWRTSLDLQRILHFARSDGTMASERQRRVLTFTDAIVAGEGNGPLSPSPFHLGALTMSESVAAVEWAHTLLMGLDPDKIPIVRQAFGAMKYPLVDFAPSDIRVVIDGRPASLDDLSARATCNARPPDGWIGHCELIRPG